MRITSIYVVSFFISLAPLNAKDLININESEISLYKSFNESIVETSANCLKRTWAEQVEFYNRWGVSKFYGDRNKSLDSKAERLAILKNNGVPTHLISKIKPISCIGLTLKCLEEGFHSTRNKSLINTWSKINSYVRANGVSGVYLLEALQKLNWKVLYWNPSPKENKAWDNQDPKLLKGRAVTWNSGVKNSNGDYIYNPGWGLHEMRYQTVMKRNKYYTLNVDNKDLLMDFGTKIPAEFTRSPFFVGVAHAGYHVFPGFEGNVIEAHSTRKLTSIDNLENSKFNPLATGGGPRWSRVEKYRSGVIAVPPGFIY
jgi:hypothetical protein